MAKQSFPLSLFETQPVFIVYLSRDLGRIKVASSAAMIDTQFSELPKDDTSERSLGAALSVRFTGDSFSPHDCMRIFGITSSHKEAMLLKKDVTKEMLKNLSQDLKKEEIDEIEAIPQPATNKTAF